MNSGVVQVFLAWIIAPGLSGAFGAIIFLVTKFAVMLRENPVWKALFLVPVYFGITACLLTMLLLWKGGAYTITLTDPEVAGTIVGVGAAWALVISIFLLPWLYRVVIKEDWQLRWWHIPLGPLLLRRADPPPAPEDQLLKDYYAGHLTKDQLDARRAAQRGDVEVVGSETQGENGEKKIPSDASETDDMPPPRAPVKKLVGPKPEGAWYTGPVLFWYVKWAFLRGVDQDVVNMQKKKSVISGDVEEIHAHAAHYDNKAEHMFSFLQVMTAATASFTHGANDISNAIGPYATVFQIWQDGKLPNKDKSEVPLWILAFGGACLVMYVKSLSFFLFLSFSLFSPSFLQVGSPGT